MPGMDLCGFDISWGAAALEPTELFPSSGAKAGAELG